MNKRNTLLVKLCAALLLLGVALPSWAKCNKKYFLAGR